MSELSAPLLDKRFATHQPIKLAPKLSVHHLLFSPIMFNGTPTHNGTNTLYPFGVFSIAPPGAIPSTPTHATSPAAVSAPPTPTPATQPTSPQPTPTPNLVPADDIANNADVRRFKHELKLSRNMLTYNEQMRRLEPYPWSTKTEGVFDPVEPSQLLPWTQMTAAEMPNCWCAHVGATHAQNFAVRIFTVKNKANKQLFGVIVAACAERRCGYWYNIGRADVPVKEMDYFTRAGGPPLMRYYPLFFDGADELLTPTQPATPAALPPPPPPPVASVGAITSPRGTQGDVGTLAETSAVTHPLTRSYTLPDLADIFSPIPSASNSRTPTQTKTKQAKSKGKGKQVTKPQDDIVAMLRNVPDLPGLIAEALGANIEGGPTTQSQTSDEDAVDSDEALARRRSPTPLFYRSPSGALTGPLGFPHVGSPTPKRRGRAHPYLTDSHINVREQAIARALERRTEGLFRDFESEPTNERIGFALSYFYQMDDPDRPGVSLREFFDTFWQCPHCKKVLTLAKVGIHREYCPDELAGGSSV